MTPWLHVVGIGADGLSGLSQTSRQIIDEADILIGSLRHLSVLGGDDRTKIQWCSPLSDTFAEIDAHRHKVCVALASGDPLWYGVGTQMIERYGRDAVHVHPHISSLQLACARLGWTVQDTAIVSLHGRPIEALRYQLGERTLVLSGPQSRAVDVARYLDNLSYVSSRMIVLERLGAPDESISHFQGQSHDPLAILAIEPGPSAGVRPWIGMPEHAFEHDGKITKNEVRAAAIAKLGQAPDGVMWDVGAGSGAVSIEWRLVRPRAEIYAIEAKAERIASIKENCRRLGIGQLNVIEAKAPQALEDLPNPTAIFVGGGLSEAGLLDTCIERLAPWGIAVAHAVTLESEQVLLEMFRKTGGELTRISLDRATPVGPFHGWRPQMPVVQYAYRKSE